MQWWEAVSLFASVFAAVGVFVQLRQVRNARNRRGLHWNVDGPSPLVLNGTREINVLCEPVGRDQFFEARLEAWGDDLTVGTAAPRRRLVSGDEPLSAQIRFPAGRDSEAKIWVGLIWISGDLGEFYEQGQRILVFPEPTDGHQRLQERRWFPIPRPYVVKYPDRKFRLLRWMVRFSRVGWWREFPLVEKNRRAIQVESHKTQP